MKTRAGVQRPERRQGRSWAPGLARCSGAALLVALAAALPLLALCRPSAGAGLSWHLQSLLHPPGAGGRPLQ